MTSFFFSFNSCRSFAVRRRRPHTTTPYRPLFFYFAFFWGGGHFSFALSVISFSPRNRTPSHWRLLAPSWPVCLCAPSDEALPGAARLPLLPLLPFSRPQPVSLSPLRLSSQSCSLLLPHRPLPPPSSLPFSNFPLSLSLSPLLASCHIPPMFFEAAFPRPSFPVLLPPRSPLTSVAASSPLFHLHLLSRLLW